MTVQLCDMYVALAHIFTAAEKGTALQANCHPIESLFP